MTLVKRTISYVKSLVKYVNRTLLWIGTALMLLCRHSILLSIVSINIHYHLPVILVSTIFLRKIIYKHNTTNTLIIINIMMIIIIMMITMIMMNSISIENNSNMDKKTILSKKTSTLVYQIILNPKN